MAADPSATDGQPHASPIWSVQALAHPGWFGGVMGTGALARVLVHNPGDIDQLSGFSRVVAMGMFSVAAVAFVALVAVQWVSLRKSGERIRDRVEAPLTGPLYAAVPGSVLVLALTVMGFEPGVLNLSPAHEVLLVVTAVSVLLGFWLTIVFFVAAFERSDFDSQTISGTWFIPETVILLGVLIFSSLARGAPVSYATGLASLTMAVMGAGFVLFLLTATLFFARLVMLRQNPATGVAAVWIFMSPLSVSAMALGSSAEVLPILVAVNPSEVSAITSIGSGLLWGFGLWWLAAAIVLTLHDGRRAVSFSPGSWGFVFPPAALTLAGFWLARSWGSSLVEWTSVILSLITTFIWVLVVAAAVRWFLRRGWAA